MSHFADGPSYGSDSPPAAIMKRLEAEIRRLAQDNRTRALCVGDRWYLGRASCGALTPEDAYVHLNQRWIWRRFKVFVPAERILANLRATLTAPG